MKGLVVGLLAVMGLAILIMGMWRMKGQIAIPISSGQEAVILLRSKYPELAIVPNKPSVYPKSGGVKIEDIIDDGWKITFFWGEGDCPSGCLRKAIWVYQVTKEGRIKEISKPTEDLTSKVTSTPTPKISEQGGEVFCGGFANVVCPPGYRCQLAGNYPDAGGKCVKQ